MLKLLKNILPDLNRIEEAALKSTQDLVIGWHCNAVIDTNKILGSGTHPDRALSRTIAISEAIERRIVSNLKYSNRCATFLLDQYPSTCGFAVGFDEPATRTRAIAEAVERWVRSQWIDFHYAIPEVPANFVESSLCPLGSWLRKSFDEIRYFYLTTQMNVDDELVDFHTAIAVGIKGEGAFVGSKTARSSIGLWTHALAEAWRHLVLFERNSERESEEMKPIVYFGNNKQDAFQQIALANKETWKKSELLLVKKVEPLDQGIYCYRALCRDFIGWHGENYKRFVY